MKRTTLRFSIRTDATIPLDELSERVGSAFGATLREGELRGDFVLETRLVGMHILLLPWCGLNRAETYQLHGNPDYDILLPEDDLDGIEFVDMNINEAIIDLLRLSGAGEWRVPSREEIEAEIAYGEELRKEYVNEGDEDDEG